MPKTPKKPKPRFTGRERSRRAEQRQQEAERRVNLNLLDAREVCTACRFSRTTLWRFAKNKKFPAGVVIGAQRRWPAHTITEWLEQSA